ncbi:MAG: PepSY-associated TM helix domain-containing protein [Porphyromonas sp.]|nr:PepSY-associated TM helix domain-containing protein [Porphyromonas sp.]
MTLKKLIKETHLWLSLPFGLIISIICFSGAMLVFEKEIMGWSNPGICKVAEVKEQPLRIDSLVHLAQKSLPEGVEVTSVRISSDPKDSYRFSITEPRRASLYVDQYTGEVKGIIERHPFFATMIKLHYALLDKVEDKDEIFWGNELVGISTIVFVIALITGVVLWWPRSRKYLAKNLKIVVGKGTWKFWYSMHNAAGMYALIFLLAMALTGLNWSYSWYRTGFYAVFGMSHQPRSGGGGHGSMGRHASEEPSTSPFLVWEEIYRSVLTENPEYKQINISKGSAAAVIGAFGNANASNRYSFNQQSGAITERMLYKDVEKQDRFRSWIYNIHVGSWGGTITRILTALAALIGSTLPITGYYLFIKRMVVKHRKRKKSTVQA